MDRDHVMTRLKRILREHFGKPEGSLTPDATLAGSLMLDSLDLVDLASLLGRTFPHAPSVEACREARSLGGLVDLLCRASCEAA